MRLKPFEGPLLKLQRARKHIADLQQFADEYIARNPVFRSVSEVPGKPNHIKAEVYIREVPPYALATILGDAIHNLRASLDLLANDLVYMNRGESGEASFPFAQSKQNLTQEIKRKKFDRASPEAVDLLRVIGPFEDGDKRLWHLHQLDIRDKHQMLVPAVGHIEHPVGGIGLTNPYTQPGSLGYSIYERFKHGPEAAILGNNLSVKFSLVFPPHGPYDMQGIVPTMTDLADHVLGIYRRFANLYGEHLIE